MHSHTHIRYAGKWCVCVCVFLASCSYCSAVYQSFGRSDDESRGPATCFLFTLLYTITIQLMHCVCVCLQYMCTVLCACVSWLVSSCPSVCVSACLPASDLLPCYVKALSFSPGSIMLIQRENIISQITGQW